MGPLRLVDRDDPKDLPRPPEDGPVHRAEHLLLGRTSARIVLGDQVYVLRLTRSGKLILTK